MDIRLGLGEVPQVLQVGHEPAGLPPVLHGVPGPVAHGHEGQARRRAQGLLGSTHRNVDVPGVHKVLLAAQGRDGVHQDEHAVFPGGGGQFVYRVGHARRRFPVHHEDRLQAWIRRGGLVDIRSLEGDAPGLFQHHRIQPESPGQVVQALSEKAVVERQDPVAGIEKAVHDHVVARVARSHEREDFAFGPDHALEIGYGLAPDLHPAVAVVGGEGIAHVGEHVGADFDGAGDHQTVVFTHGDYLWMCIT